MNRMEEYLALQAELTRWPPALDGTAERARRRARRRRRERRIGFSVGSLAGICAAFVLAVNVLPTFALACGRVPVLREIAAAVAFSPSLSAAVEHDYVQYVGQSRTSAGATITVECFLADAQQMVVFYRAEGIGDAAVSARVLREDGTELTGCVITGSTLSGGLRRMEILFPQAPPEHLELAFRLYAADGAATLQQGSWQFSLHLDPERTAQPVTVPVHAWVELDGRRLEVEELTLTPTRTALHVAEDPDNDAWLQDLDFYFTDRSGTVYEAVDGIVAAVGSGAYYFQSLYFLEDRSDLTLWIDGAVWLDKSEPVCTVDLADGTWEGALPEGAGNLRVDTAAEGPVLTVETADADWPVFTYAFRDEDGETRDLLGFGAADAWVDDGGISHPRAVTYHFPPEAAGETVELRLDYTDFTALDEPVAVAIP